MNGAWSDVQRLLAVCLGSVGDVLMLSPALRALQRALPGARISLLASSAGAEAARLLPELDPGPEGVLAYDPPCPAPSVARDGAPASPPCEQDLIEALKARRFEAAAIFTPAGCSPYLPAHVCYLAGIPLRLGQSQEFGGGVLSRWIRPAPGDGASVPGGATAGRGATAADAYLDMLQAAGCEVHDRYLDLRVPADVQDGVDAQLQRLGVLPQPTAGRVWDAAVETPFVLLVPRLGDEVSTYDPACYRAIARTLGARTGWSVLLAGGGEDRRVSSEAPAGRDNGPVLPAAWASVAHLAGLVRRAHLVCTGDPDVLPLADAFRRTAVLLPALQDAAPSRRRSVAGRPVLRREHARKRVDGAQAGWQPDGRAARDGIEPNGVSGCVS